MATDTPMQLGMVGLGRMGANLVRRLMRDGHRCVVYDVQRRRGQGARGRGRDRGRRRSRTSCAKLDEPRGGLDHGARRRSCRPPSSELRPLLGGRRHRDRRRQLLLPRRHRPGRSSSQRHGIHYVDCGTSGGVWGLDRGYCLMIGGEDDAVSRLDPIFKTIAPGDRAAPSRRPAGPRPTGTAPRRVPALRAERRGPLRQDGPQRHRVRDDGGDRRGPVASSSTPTSACTSSRGRRRDHAAARPRGLPVRHRRGRGRRGVAARLGGRLLARRPDRRRARPSPDLDDFSGRVSDSGEGRWTVLAAASTRAVPAPVITAALYERFESREPGRVHRRRSCRRCARSSAATPRRRPDPP